MKKVLAAVLSLLLIVSAFCFFACDKPGSVSPEAPTEEPSEAPNEEPTEMPAETSDEEPESTPFALPEPNEYASAETRTLAEGIITKMREENHNFSPGTSTYADHYATFQWSMPEMADLEKAEDGALALIELYEDLILVYSQFDIVGYRRDMLAKNNDPSIPATELYTRGMELLIDNIDIEGLLSMPSFFDKLSEDQKTRFYSDVNILWNMQVAASRSVEGDDTDLKSFFDASRREQDISWKCVFVPATDNT